MELLEFIKLVLEWIVAPVSAFVWIIYTRQQQHATEIAVLKANASSIKETHDRELSEIRETSRAIMSKLDSIEQALRK